MNLVKFFRRQASTGTVEVRRVPVIQPSYATMSRWRGGVKRRPMVAEAENIMLNAGWTRDKRGVL